MVNNERYIASDGDMKVYAITEILDSYDFGGTGSGAPGEYVSEARMLSKVALEKNGLVTGHDVIEVMASQFSWKNKPILKYKFNRAARQITQVFTHREKG